MNSITIRILIIAGIGAAHQNLQSIKKFFLASPSIKVGVNLAKRLIRLLNSEPAGVVHFFKHIIEKICQFSRL
jgi:hypothetical protein